MAYVDGNEMVLVNVPRPPPGFLNISETDPGKYVVGHTRFFAKDVHLFSVLRREFGPADEIVLAIQSVFLIAFLSELVHAVLLRRRGETVSASGIRAASFVDEVVHMRHLLQHFCSCTRRQQDQTRDPRAVRSNMTASLIVIIIAAFLFLAEVASVLLTQPTEVSSGKYDYNVRAVQPVGTAWAIAKFIRRDTGNNGCVSPLIWKATQPRKYLINACFKYESVEALNDKDNVSDTFVVSSWYHVGGSDHTIEFGPGSFSVQIRARVFVEEENIKVTGPARRLLFDSRDDEAMSHAQYLQTRTIYAAMQWSCNKEYTSKSCEQLLSEVKRINKTYVNKTFTLWRAKKVDFNDTAKGLVTTWKVGINAPYGAINQAISILSSSAGILEVQGGGRYVNVRDGSREDGIAGLLIEKGRIAGVFLFGIVVGTLLLVLIGIRVWLRPVALSDFAMDRYCEEERFIFGFPEDIGAGDVGIDESFDAELGRIQAETQGHASTPSEPRVQHTDLGRSEKL